MPPKLTGQPWEFNATTQGEGRANVGSFMKWATFTTTHAAETLTITGHGLSKGAGPVRLTTTGTLPAGFAASTNYWVIYVDANTIQLAATPALAAAGTAVAISDDGSGTHTLSIAPIFPVDIYVEQFKVETGDGGAVQVHDKASGRELIFLDSSVANDAVWFPMGCYVEGIYITSLPANGRILVYHGKHKR